MVHFIKGKPTSPFIQWAFPQFFSLKGQLKIRFLPLLLNCPVGKQFKSAIDFVPPTPPIPSHLFKKKKNPQCLFRGLFISENNTCGNTYFNFTILFIQELKPILQYVQSHPGPSSPSPWVHRHNNPILHRSSCPLKWYCNKFLSLTPCAFSHNFFSPCPQFFCLLPTACIVVLQFVNVKAAEGVPFTLHPYKPETDKK